MTTGPGESRARARLRDAIARDLGLKAAALLLAVLLWLVVGARRPTEGYVAVRLEPALDSSLVLLEGTPPVRALVAGRAADLVQLHAMPPVVRHAIDGDAPDTLTLPIAPADVHVAPELAGRVRVIEVEPRAVTLRFEARATRRVPVVNAGRITTRDAGAAVAFGPDTVRISGTRAAVRRVAAIHPVPLELDAADTLPRMAELDTAGLGVRANPARVRVRLVRTGSR